MTTTTTTTTTVDPWKRGINSASGYYGSVWPASGAIPQSFSMGGWTLQNRGFVQQTFLGASIRSFTMNGGFGDNSSTLSVELVNDEYNFSDQTPAGYGDDVYHSGCIGCTDGRPSGDKFAPPMVGSPVFFKFGQQLATVEEAYKQTFDDLYNMVTSGSPIPFPGSIVPINFANSFGDAISYITSIPNGYYINTNDAAAVNLNPYLNDPNLKGRNHIVFGGILQSYVQNRGPGGNPLYSVQVIDPREILSNVTLILNNYAGTTYNSNNIINVYGFLEHNLPEAAINRLRTRNVPPLSFENTLQKFVYTNDAFPNQIVVSYSGNDTYHHIDLIDLNGVMPPILPPNATFINGFPITGTSFSRRGSQGIPYYRVKQAVNAMLEYEGALPIEYKQKGFSTKINFRGFNYVVDFGSLPDLPGSYYLDFDEINLLDLALEICDATSHDLFVTLLPVINHPACSYLYNYNLSFGSDPKTFQASGIAGIIRLDAIDRSTQPQYGAIKSYIDSLATSGIYVENQDVGYELSNVTTDKFIVGAQEVENYFFTTNNDRDTNIVIAKKDKWTLETSLVQQLLPYYGLLGKSAVTIPKGFGAYQQILLDTTGLDANGVGPYYVATEMELRCAMISFERWKEFLLQYNDSYVTSIEINDLEETGLLLSVASGGEGKPEPNPISNNYAVTVPRSLFPTYATGVFPPFGPDNLPSSPCNPPYGYPLYYKRATKIGIPEAGLTSIASRINSVINSYQLLANSSDKSNYKAILNSEFARLRSIRDYGEMSEFEKQYFDRIETLIEQMEAPTTTPEHESIEKTIIFIEEYLKSAAPILSSLGKISKKNTENALKVYNFVKGVADECLGKKFLVKIPKATNLFYNDGVILPNAQASPTRFTHGPFGFRPRPLTSKIGYEFSPEFANEIISKLGEASSEHTGPMPFHELQHHLGSGTEEKFSGSLKCNYNPIADQIEFNYVPTNDGGFFDFDLYANFMSASNIYSTDSRFIPLGLSQTLIPIDLTNFINENKRVSAYVRFDHSQFLSLENLNSDDFIQQIKTANGFIVDFNENLDNVKDTDNPNFRFPNLSNSQNEPPPNEQVAFVKCSVDDKFYMPPKCIISGVPAAGRGIIPIETFVPPGRIYDPCEDKYNDSFSFYHVVYVPDSTLSGSHSLLMFDCHNPSNNLFNSMLIKTDLKNLDTNNVYALITIPGRVIPTKDGRYRDSIFQSLNAEQFKRYLTMDTVDLEVPGFDKPIIEGKPTQLFDKLAKKNVQAANRAWFAARKATKSLSFGFPNQVNFAMPSPIYPDLVCLPLMSKERCYGPWVSSQIDVQSIVYSNIGGKIEFIKDENLAPWNYDGYHLMNEAAMLQARFAQSLLLFSERGGFVVPGLPPKVSLGKNLLNAGPLVTNMQVDVSDAGIHTTVKMDLYTASFGKLQKQKQDAISKLSRERQKLKDEKNALIRKGLGKAQASKNYLKEYEKLQKSSEGVLSGREDIFSGPGNALTTIGISVNKDEQSKWSSNPLFRTHTINQYGHQGSIQKQSQAGRVAQEFIYQDDLASAWYNTALSTVNDIFSPVSLAPDHQNMPSQQSVAAVEGFYSLYFNQETPFKESDIIS